MNHENGVGGVNPWRVRGSRQSRDCVNPVRSCVENCFQEALEQRNKSKQLINLSLGDPSVFGCFPPPPSAPEGVRQALDAEQYNGYAHSSGMLKAKEAVAEKYSTPQEKLSPADIVMAHSCCGALLRSFEVLCDPGSTVLIPSPGFGLYQCHADALGLVTKTYNLLPERNWEVDLEHLESLLDDTVSAILVNNPSNPCGSVYSRQHLLDLLQVAERHHCPVISDDIYQDMVFAGQEYASLASLSINVPILSCGGISKRYMVPGWRLGWIIIHDRNHAFQENIRPGLSRLAMKLMGPCTLVQAALPHMLKHTPQEFHDRNMANVRESAELVFKRLKAVPGLVPVMPAGSMYMMVSVDLNVFREFDSSITFTKQLLVEESVFCLPGEAFHATSCFRVVLMMSEIKTNEAMDRIVQFCNKHAGNKVC